ncbi:unnamed protein product [Macrosiphum euphorbiae]|uniref:DUF4806 domain-containing protein n=1 Tax=Macrosiphum euphorbiae TaxID=13131 RepID=A0AAV0Y889_9HEMI|nr:unnamed protein product [Macrosiphum euphorbiae]
MLEDQANKQIFSNGDNSLIDYNPMADLYPIEGLDDLNKIEEQILLDTEYRKKIVHDLSNNIGEKNVNSSVKKMMIQLFDDKLLAQFSFAGRKLTSKKSFQSLGFYKIIDEATKKMSKFKGVVRQEEIDDAIKYMLIQAPFRLKRKTEQENAALLK